MKTELIGLSDWVWGRTASRLEELSDEELSWEPYPACWSIRRLRDGAWVSDYTVPPPEVPPLTTIAWRLIHLIGCYGSARNSTWLGVDVDAAPLESWEVTPTSAAEATSLLEAAHRRWRLVLEALDEAALGGRIGPVGGPFAESTRASFAWHQLDEVIHHGAEVALMRDLHRAASGPTHLDRRLVRLMGGDLSVFAEASGRTDLVSALAAVGRWDLVEEALQQGLPPDGPPPTALHRAAAIGLIPIIDQLLAAGADPGVRDPQFQATPAEWAARFGHQELSRRLAFGNRAGG
ncbi:MAG TPA: DinB family protein [Acidimicrobiales bacterium]|nr:DinB family protein [Acidimicrobiales bacterium]